MRTLYKVLLVDDEHKALEGLEIMVDWKAMGFEICGLCTNGEEAVRQIQHSFPHVVITDIRMPGMSGLELIEYIKKNVDPDIRFVIMSAYSEFEYAKRAMAQGVNHYILKPIIEEEVYEVLHEVYEQLEKQSKFEHLREEFDRETIVNIILKLIQGKYVDENLKKKILSHYDDKEWYCILIEMGRKVHAQETTSIIRGIEQYIGLRKDVFLLNMNTNYEGIIIGLDKRADTKREIRHFAHGVYHTIQSLYNICIDMVISHGVPSILQMKDAYTAALETMKFRVFMSDSGIISYEQIKDQSIRFELEKIRYVEQLFEALENADSQKVDDIIRMVEEEFYTKQISPDILKMFIVNVVYKTIHFIEETDRDDEKLLSRYNINRLLQSYLTIEEMITILKNYCRSLIQYVSELRDQKSKGILYDIKLYIRDHFHECLTIRKIANHFYMNPIYLGQIFTKTYGMGINDYLHKLRIEEAKRLLKHTSMKLNEIANKVGYSNYSRFIKKFEQYQAMKPLEYKKKFSKDSQGYI